MELPLNPEFMGQWCPLSCGLYQLPYNKQVPISLSGHLGGRQVFFVLNPEWELVSLGTIFSTPVKSNALFPTVFTRSVFMLCENRSFLLLLDSEVFYLQH